MSGYISLGRQRNGLELLGLERRIRRLAQVLGTYFFISRDFHLPVGTCTTHNFSKGGTWSRDTGIIYGLLNVRHIAMNLIYTDAFKLHKNLRGRQVSFSQF